MLKYIAGHRAPMMDYDNENCSCATAGKPQGNKPFCFAKNKNGHRYVVNSRKIIIKGKTNNF